MRVKEKCSLEWTQAEAAPQAPTLPSHLGTILQPQPAQLYMIALRLQMISNRLFVTLFPVHSLTLLLISSLKLYPDHSDPLPKMLLHSLVK